MIDSKIPKTQAEVVRLVADTRLDERRRIIKMLEKYDEPIWADDFIDKIERGKEKE